MNGWIFVMPLQAHYLHTVGLISLNYTTPHTKSEVNRNYKVKLSYHHSDALSAYFL